MNYHTPTPPPLFLPDNGTPTSKAAAASVAPNVGTDLALVLSCIKAAGEHGATREEIQAATGLDGNTVRPRVWTLVRTGQVIPCGCRLNSGGRTVEVLKSPNPEAP